MVANPKEFFELFLADQSNFNTIFQTKRTNREVTLSNWAINEAKDVVRDLKFRTDISAKLGPTSTRVEEKQYLRICEQNEVLIETITQTLDIPFGDNFRCEAAWHITSSESGATIINIYFDVVFMKSTWGLKGVISKGAVDGSKEYLGVWCSLAKEQVRKGKETLRAVIVPKQKKILSPGASTSKSNHSKSHKSGHSHHTKKTQQVDTETNISNVKQIITQHQQQEKGRFALFTSLPISPGTLVIILLVLFVLLPAVLLSYQSQATKLQNEIEYWQKRASNFESQLQIVANQTTLALNSTNNSSHTDLLKLKAKFKRLHEALLQAGKLLQETQIELSKIDINIEPTHTVNTQTEEEKLTEPKKKYGDTKKSSYFS